MSTATLPAAAPAFALEVRAADANTPFRARHWLAWLLESAEVSQDTVDTALLVASELVTNAVVHGRPAGRVVVSAQVLDDGVRLVVHGDAPISRWREPGGEMDERGRGLVLVEALAEQLHVVVHAAGVTVTALIPHTP